MSDERNPIIGQPDLIWNQMMERMKNEPLDLTPTTPGGKDAEQRLKLVGELGEAAARIRLLEQQLSTAREEERERCAKVADEAAMRHGDAVLSLTPGSTANHLASYASGVLTECAAAIRSLGEKE